MTEIQKRLKNQGKECRVRSQCKILMLALLTSKETRLEFHPCLTEKATNTEQIIQGHQDKTEIKVV